MRFTAIATCWAGLASAQQFMGNAVNNSLPSVPGSEIAYWKIQDPSGKGANLTLINYQNLGTNGQRQVSANIKRAIIVIHGMARDAGTYEMSMTSALSGVKTDSNINPNSVSIVAPFFANGDDKNYGYPFTSGLPAGQGSTSDCLVWQDTKWSAGANNQYPYKTKVVSSYTVLDQLVLYYDNKTMFPNINQIVVAGHSLGAQTVQRYAAIGNQLNTKTPVSYWIANPDSYVWFSTSRPLDTSDCPSYDDYRAGFSAFADYPMTYGLDLVNQGRFAVGANWNSKQTMFARGEADDGDDSTGCADGTTGSNRNERMYNFLKAFPASCPNPTGDNCDTVDLVPGVGHNAPYMMASTAGMARLFFDNFYGNGNRSFDFGYPRQLPNGEDDPYPNPALNTSASSVNNKTYAGNMTYSGCWSDQSPPTLPNMTYSGSANTIEFCTSTCAQGGNTIAGLENGSQCFCGTSLGYKATEVIEGSCVTACSGNSSESCGGNNRLSIFSNGKPMVWPEPDTPETVANFTSVGCYTEGYNIRALTGATTRGPSVDLEYCANFCASFNYFGAEFGNECFCGNMLNNGSNLTITGDCSMTCAANSLEFCGAGERLTMFKNNAFNVTAASSILSASSTATSTPTASASSGPSCPGSNNTIVTSGGKQFMIECGIDHKGGDLTYAGVSNFQACIDDCAKNAQCVDVSLSGSTCFLKSSLQAGVAASAISGARLLSSGSTSITSTSSTKISTTSSVTAKTSTAATSTSHTSSTTSTTSKSSTSSTKASSSSTTSSHTSTTLSSSSLTSSPSKSSSSTSTKSSTSTATSISSKSSSSSPSATPSTLSCPASNNTVYTAPQNKHQFLIECGIDHAGGDMKLVYVSNFAKCVNLCDTTTGCIDVSMSGDACYLKSTLEPAKTASSILGAKLVQ